MNVENPAALRYILQDDLYLLKQDKTAAVPLAKLNEEQAPVKQEPEVTAPAVATPSVQIPAVEIPKLQAPIVPKVEVPSEPVQPPVVQTPQTGFNYLGGNKKQLLILTHYTSEEFIDAQHLAALENILKRKDFTLDDVAILNMARQTNADMGALKNEFKPVKLLVLGADAMPAGIKLPFNQLKQGTASAALLSFGFAEMMSSNENKKAFWEQMKNL